MSNNPKENCRIIGIDIHPRCFAAAAMTLKNKKQLWVHSRVELKDLDSWLKNQKFDFECRKFRTPDFRENKVIPNWRQ